MGLAFWRSKKRAADAAAKPATRPPLSTDDDPRLDPAAGLRARARHRLIGASALLLAVAIIVPMVLDPEPKRVSENIPIDIPSERTPFAPRLSLPPVPAAETMAVPPQDRAPVPDAAKPEPALEPKAEAKQDPKQDPKADAKVEAKPAAKPEARVVETEAARAEEARKPAEPATATKANQYVVQAAAPASEKSARQLVERLKKAGFAAYTERVETKDGTRHRVRTGPYATRDEAERAHARLKAQGINGNLVAL